MNILVIGEEANYNECRSKFGNKFHYIYYEGQPNDLNRLLTDNDVVFDFSLHKNPGRLKSYVGKAVTVFADTSQMTLGQFAKKVDGKIQCTLFGFCGMPTLFNRSFLEISLYRPEDEEALKKVCSSLNTEYRIVEDRIGFVTPRVVCMIINEAYFAVEEGVANRDDIDSAMRLGTNYPFGPFEWCKKIGVKNVHDLLSAVYQETKDDRYKICSLLKSESMIKNA